MPEACASTWCEIAGGAAPDSGAALDELEEVAIPPPDVISTEPPEPPEPAGVDAVSD